MENVVGMVEDVMLWVIKLCFSEGEVFIVFNGNIVKLVNLFKDWVCVVVDIFVLISVDFGCVNEVLY